MIDPMEGFEIEVHWGGDIADYPEQTFSHVEVRSVEHRKASSSNYRGAETKWALRQTFQQLVDRINREVEREKAREVYGFRDDSMFPDPVDANMPFFVDPAQWAMANRGATQAWPTPLNDVKAIQARIKTTLDLFLGKGLGGGS